MKKLKVYIAGPYSNGDTPLNVTKAMELGEECLQNGMVPFIPHLTMFQHMAYPRPYEDWLAYDIEWLKVCDAILRFPGQSSGADKEVEIAELMDIPVFYYIQDLVDFKNSKLPWVLFNINTKDIWNKDYDTMRESRVGHL